MIVSKFNTTPATYLTTQGSGSKVSVFPQWLLILSRLIPCSSWTEYCHAPARNLKNSSACLRSNSEQDSADPSLDLDGKRRLTSDSSYDNLYEPR